MRRAIITGATGAIGMALAELLIKENIEVLVLTRSESKRNEQLRKLADSFGNGMINIVECDYSGLSEMENNTGKDWDCFFHLAWAGASGPGRNDMYLQNGNVRMSLDAVALAKRFGCRKFVGAGSQAEYGRPYIRIKNEDSTDGSSVTFDDRYRLRPDTPAFPEMGYGYAKLCAGQMTRDYAHQLGLEHNWLRVLSVFGPYDGESILKQAVRSFKDGISPDFTKGEQIWDFVYSKDAALAFYDVAEKGTDGKTYVLGSGAERPLAEYLSVARDIICPGLELKLGARPYGENQVMFLAADTSELKNDTGFECRYTFEEGIRDMMGYSDNQ